METTTSAATNAAPSASSTSSASLFNNDENRFLQDTLASAHSFDPFQHGAPGFKVPAVLPPGLIQSMVNNGNNAGTATSNNPGSSSAFGATPGSWSNDSHFNAIHPQQPSDRSRTNSWTPGMTSMPGPSSSQGQGQNESFVAFVRRTQGNAPFGTGSSPPPPPTLKPQQQQQQQHQRQFTQPNPHAHFHSHSQSFSGPSTGGGGAYGQNMAWKMQQLEALQAERRRYMESVGTSGGMGEGGATVTSPLDYQQQPTSQQPPHLQPPPPPSSSFGGSSSSPATNASPHSHHPSHQSPHHPQASSSATDLSTLGLSFPSSHDFPAATPPSGMQWDPEQQAYGGGMPLQQQQQSSSALRNPGQPQPAAHQRLKSSSGSSPQRNRRPSASTAVKPEPMDDSQGQGSSDYKPWPKAPSPSAPSAAYPPLSVDPGILPRSTLRSKASTSRYEEAFYGRDPAEERRRFQPHLVDLKERRREERKRKAEAMEEKKAQAMQKQQQQQGGGQGTASGGGDDSGSGENEAGDAESDADEDDDDDDDGEGESSGKKKKGSSSTAANGNKKPPHTLLTEAEKKANHIASEQKRRANIRKGYELLCQGVPSLREALERGDDATGGGGASMDTGGDDTSNNNSSTVDGTSLEIGGEKIDGRAGPRSEAVVLGKSVEHLRYLLEVHRDLRSRRDHARVKLARGQFGVDLIVNEKDAHQKQQQQQDKQQGGGGGAKGKKGGGVGGSAGKGKGKKDPAGKASK